jgi:hypothetical protein
MLCNNYIIPLVYSPPIRREITCLQYIKLRILDPSSVESDCQGTALLVLWMEETSLRYAGSPRICQTDPKQLWMAVLWLWGQ